VAVFLPPEEHALDARNIIVAVLVTGLVVCAIVYGRWLRKGEEEDRKKKQ
jgi:hypothetical protein